MTSSPGRGAGDMLTNKYSHTISSAFFTYLTLIAPTYLAYRLLRGKNACAHNGFVSKTWVFADSAWTSNTNTHTHTDINAITELWCSQVMLPVPLLVHRPQFGQHWHQPLHASVAVCFVSQFSSITPIAAPCNASDVSTQPSLKPFCVCVCVYSDNINKWIKLLQWLYKCYK